MSKNDKGTMSAQEQAEYAYAYNSPWGLSSEAKVIYDRMVAEGGVPRKSADAPETPADPLAGLTQRSSPETRARILAMIKKANSKYAKPFEKDRLAGVSLLGTESWADYGQVVLQMAILDTLLSIEEKLNRLAGQPGEQDTPSLQPRLSPIRRPGPPG